jgi:hypothetical protein
MPGHIAGELIHADMIEATACPDLSTKRQVMGVLRTVINKTVHLEGSASEPMLLAQLFGSTLINRPIVVK